MDNDTLRRHGKSFGSAGKGDSEIQACRESMMGSPDKNRFKELSSFTLVGGIWKTEMHDFRL